MANIRKIRGFLHLFHQKALDELNAKGPPEEEELLQKSYSTFFSRLARTYLSHIYCFMSHMS